MQEELLNISYDNLTLSSSAAAIIALTLSIGLWESVATFSISLWLGLSLLTYTFRYITAKFYATHYRRFNVEQWERYFYIGLLASSILWAAFPLLFFTSLDIMMQTFVMIMLIGLASGASNSLATSKKYVYTFFISVLLPLALVTFLQGSSLYMFMSGILIIYLLMISALAFRLNTNLLTTLHLKQLYQDSERNLKRSEECISKIFEQVPIGIFSYDEDFNLVEVNQGLSHILNIEIKDLKKSNLKTLFNFEDTLFQQSLIGVFKGEDGFYEGAYVHPLSQTTKWITLKATPILDSTNNIEGAFVILNDITEEKNREKRISFLAYHDALTKLPNRILLNDRLHQVVSHIKHNNEYATLMFLDLDHFKTINDSLGHHIGDMLLQEFTRRIQTIILEEDTFSRLGGDEFILLLPTMYQTPSEAIEAAHKVTTKVHTLMKDVFLIEEYPLHITTSIGVTLIDETNLDQNNILKYADLAMYQAKEAGRNRTCFYEKQMEHAILKRLTLENNLHHALTSNEFKVFYQPILECQTNTITGAEALLRYQTKDGTMVYPDDFIPAAEASGIIVPIGYWVIEEVCKQFAQWQESIPNFPLKNIAINISPKQFIQDDFVSKLMAIVDTHKINPSIIELELTESVFIKDTQNAILKMQQLKTFGFILSMDDFGTGYSSLSYLKNLPFDIIKIDKSFMENIMHSKEDEILVTAILDLSKKFHMKVIAEGIEEKAQVEFLQKNVCDYYQGYIVSKPVPAQEFEKILSEEFSNRCLI